MTENRKGAVATVIVLAAFLAGIGIWQFGNLGFGGSEDHKLEDEHAYEERYMQHRETVMPPGDVTVMLERIASDENARIVEIERESEHGRDVYELKLVGSDGRELKIDSETGEVVNRD